MTILKHSPVGECFFVRRCPALAIAGVAAILTLGACGTRAEEPAPDDVAFDVDLGRVGSIYENETLGMKYRPPVNWDRLEGDQRQTVLDALASSGNDDDYSLEVTDIFFDTDSMSFSSIAVVTGADANPTVDAYAQALGATLGLNDGDATDEANALVARMEFLVNDVPIVQFRHLQSDRVTFTLLFPSKAGDLIQLDYSIPTENYQHEAEKLESSIGTLQLIPVD
ncbi:MAG: hypothetical protein V3S41_08295 [Spirochaetia bacterium]